MGIRKAVIPVAGLGTRFLPATKCVPKEMLPIVDRPIIQFVVDEAREAGIEHFIFVTGRHKGIIEDYFDRQFELETVLERRHNGEELELLSASLPDPGQTSFTRQQEPLGLGHAVWCARHLVGNEPFAVLLPDVIVDSEPGCLAQLTSAYANAGGNIVAIERKPASELHRYGVVDVIDGPGNCFLIAGMVEKPEMGKAPSDLVISGRYILQPEIFHEIENLKPGASQEIQLTDAMRALTGSQRFLGCKFSGEAFDCGEKAGYLAANVHLAMKRPELARQLLQIFERELSSRKAAAGKEPQLARSA